MTDKSLNLAPRALPLLEAGKYHIEVSQESNVNSSKIESSSLDFHVKTDRISMSTGEVYSVYPPKDCCSSLGNCLPHIVLHRRTLPWEHVVRDVGVPWLALLVVSENDKTVASTMKYSESLEPEIGLLIPNLHGTEDIDKNQVCQTVTMPYQLFADILPMGEDLPYLAHVRGVDLDCKVTDKEVKGNWFSCIIANRYPEDSRDKDTRIQHTAHLVSLEGFSDYIYSMEKRRGDSGEYDRVRMYSLYSWGFQVESNAHFDFYNLGRSLTADTLQSRVEVREPSVDKLLKLGYVPMSHYFRESTSTISWYHSPFVPQNPQWDDNVKVRFMADELLEYDPENGMFNISYSAAWQLGRLLALADKDLSNRILNWRLDPKIFSSSKSNAWINKGEDTSCKGKRSS